MSARPLRPLCSASTSSALPSSTPRGRAAGRHALASGPLLGLAASLLLTSCGAEVSFGAAPVDEATQRSAPSATKATEKPLGSRWELEADRAPTWSAPAADTSAQSGMYSLPGMACLVNEFGIRAKVLITEDDVQCVDRVPGGVLTGAPLQHFFPYYVFDAYPSEEQPTHYLVGSTPKRESIVGWAPAHSSARWDTRVGVRYMRGDESRRQLPLRVYRDSDSLVDLLAQGHTDAQPIAAADPDHQQTLMPWPVAETRQVEVNGSLHELVRITFLAELVEGADLAVADTEEIAAPEVYTTNEIADIREGVRMLDVVFCVDNTHSTGDFIVAIRQAVQNIARQLDSLPFRPDVNFGLVLYRDYVDGILYRDSGGYSVTRNFGLEGDLDSFLRRVEPLREASASSIDWAEAGYDGVMDALTKTAWRAGRLSTRAVVLIGDNAFHEPGHEKNPNSYGLADVRAAAQARGVKIFSLGIDGKGGSEEQSTRQEQFDSIASATGGRSFSMERGQEGFSREEADRVVSQVRSIMDDQTEIVYTRAVVLDELIGGNDQRAIAADHDLDIREVTEVLEFLDGAGIDVNMLGPGVPSFATGWVLSDMRGVPMVEREVYVARPELEMLLAALTMLNTNLSPSLGRDVFGLGLAGRVDPLSSFFQGEVPEPLDVFLMAKGIPVGRSSILRMPASEIRHMSEDSRAELRERIASSVLPNLLNARNDAGLWYARDDLDFGWVAESVLP